MDIAISNYQLLEKDKNKIYYFSPDSAGAQNIMKAVDQSLNVYSNWFGPLDNFQGFTVIEVPEGYGSQADVTSILGARTKDLLILEDQMKAVSDELVITTDDGSYGMKGLVTDAIKKLVDDGNTYDQCVCMGPPIMMKFVSLLTKELGIPCIVSLNPIMVDGTGMCGGCRVTVGDETKFACVDGPEFDGHLVDFDEMMGRLTMYNTFEKDSLEHYMGETGCKLEDALKGDTK